MEYDFRCAGFTFDLKADTRMAETQNFFIETESVKGKKKGWLYNTSTDWILYLDVNNLTLYILDLKMLQRYEKTILTWRYDEIDQEEGYKTCGHIVPINHLKKLMKFQGKPLKPLAELTHCLEG